MIANKLALMAAVLLLAGCGGKEVKYVGVTTSEPFCKAVEVTCISKDDVLTEPTAQSIEGNNRGIQSACKRKTQCKPDKPTS